MSVRAAVIDAHFHLWDQSFPHRPFPWTPDPFPLADALRVLDEHGVRRGINVTPIMYGFDNAYGVQSQRESADRIALFGRFDAFAPAPLDRLRALLARHPYAGIRLTFYGNDLALLQDPAALNPFWSACEQLGVRVAVFAPDALWEIVRAVERHPRLRLIVDHLGLGAYPGCEDPFRGYPALVEFAPFPQVLVKISGVVEISREPFPFRDMHDHLAAAVESFGAQRLLWGSNYPVVLETCSYGESLRFVDECAFLSPTQRDRILGGTAAAMLAEQEGRS